MFPTTTPSTQCLWSARHYAIFLSSPAFPMEACAEAIDLCWTDSMTPAGDVACSLKSLSPGSDQCEREDTCTLDVVADGAPAKIEGSLLASCERGAGSQWQCTCSKGADGLFAITGEDGLTACSAAIEACKENLDVWNLRGLSETS